MNKAATTILFLCLSIKAYGSFGSAGVGSNSCPLLCQLSKIVREASTQTGTVTRSPSTYTGANSGSTYIQSASVPSFPQKYPSNILDTIKRGPYIKRNCHSHQKLLASNGTGHEQFINASTKRGGFFNFGKNRTSSRAKMMIETLRKNAALRCTGKNQNTCKRAKVATKSTGLCWRYVKLGLMGGQYTDDYIASQYAYEAFKHGHLKKIGFVNNIEKYGTAENAPPGAILVYKKVGASGGVPGHIEVKASDNEYISDYISDKPINHPSELGTARRLVGIYVEGESA